MSESGEQPKITNDVKPKDPRRVEAGKRLGAISKMAKERKREQLEEQRKHQEKYDKFERESETYDDEGSSSTTLIVLAVLGVIGGGLYYMSRRAISVDGESP